MRRYLASNELLDSPDGSCDEIMETDNDPLTVMKIELEKCGLDLPTDEELMPSDDDILVPDVEQFEPLRIMRVWTPRHMLKLRADKAERSRQTKKRTDR